MPGCISHKVFIAEDGERVTVCKVVRESSFSADAQVVAARMQDV